MIIESMTDRDAVKEFCASINKPLPYLITIGKDGYTLCLKDKELTVITISKNHPWYDKMNDAYRETTLRFLYRCYNKGIAPDDFLIKRILTERKSLLDENREWNFLANYN